MTRRVPVLGTMHMNMTGVFETKYQNIDKHQDFASELAPSRVNVSLMTWAQREVVPGHKIPI